MKPLATNSIDEPTVALEDQTFSVPFRHLFSTSFTGAMTSAAGTPNGISRFVGDHPNRLLRYFAEPTTTEQNEAGSVAYQQRQTSGSQWPLVLFGPSGTGKTSLAMSIIAQMTCNEAQPPLFISAVDFDRRYRSALTTDSVDDFVQIFLDAPAVVIDDLHRLVKKPMAQRQLIRILDDLDRKNRAFVVTMDSSPVLCEALDIRLTSRLSAGLCLPVNPPGRAARQEIVRELAEVNLVSLTDDAVDMIIDRLDVTVPKLSHFFAQLQLAIRTSSDGLSSIIPDHESIDATRLIKLFQRGDVDHDQMAKLILKLVASEFHLKVSDIRSNRRNQSIVLARGIAIYLQRSLLELSFQKIGSYFGNRDHSTVLHAFRKIKSIVESDIQDPEQAATVRTVQHLKRQLTEQFASSNGFL